MASKSKEQKQQEEREAKQEEEDDEYDRLYDEAWALTTQADDLGTRLCAAHNTSPEMFEQVRQEVEEFLTGDPRSRNGYAYLGHLEGWLMLFGLDIATARPLGA